MKTTSRRSVPRAVPGFLAALLAFAPAAAQAHSGAGAAGGFALGLGHPLLGLDHLLAMVAVGIWAAQIGGRAVWAVPLSFAGVMALGGALGMAGVGLPFAEQGILLSVLALGLLVAAAVRPSVVTGMVLAAAFALFHGHAHGAEMPPAASGVLYGAGFVLGTLLLHLSGIAFARGAQRATRPAVPVLRFAGAAIALCGACLWLL
uniref:Nickel-binding accessory protein UreJ-HupE n=1 Tax=uncultured Armatimonadetes bacterium TaxID=157466 RepID=A0A6J4H3A2_9BACT|nr:Nickel-binding accessory protein UreJ-HupE [uncultured Armatimonadetes bacterium]